jgi:hypothetical protein
VTCHRRGEGVGRLSAKRSGVTHPLRQSPDRHATRRGANACQPFMKGLKRLRKAAFWPTAQVSSKSLESYWPGSSSSSCEAPSLPICHQIRTGDQPKDREGARACNPGIIPGSRRQGGRMMMPFAAPHESLCGPSRQILQCKRMLACRVIADVAARYFQATKPTHDITVGVQDADRRHIGHC